MPSSLQPHPQLSPGTLSRTAQLALLLATGLMVAAAVVFDPSMTRSLSRSLLGGWSTTGVPYLLSPVLLAVIALLTIVVLNGKKWFAHQYEICVMLIFIPTQFVGVNIANLEATKFGLLSVLYLWLLDTFANRRPIRLFMPIILIWLGILCFAIASILNGLVASIGSMYVIIAKLLMFLLVINILRNYNLLQLALKTLVYLAIFSAVAALIQEAIFYFLGIPISFNDNAAKEWFKGTPFGVFIRASAFHPTAQNLAHSLLLATTLILFGPYSTRFKTIALTLTSAAMFLTFSGNALIILVGVLAITPIVKAPHKTLHYLAIVLLVLLVCYETGAMHWIYEKFMLPIIGKSSEDRVSLLQLGIDIITRNPLIGIGLHNFGRVSPQPVHNAYFQLATEIGVIAGLLLIAMFLLILIRLVMAGLRQTDPVRKSTLQGVALGFTALIIHFMFEPFIDSMVSWSFIGLAEATAMIMLVPEPINTAKEPNHD